MRHEDHHGGASALHGAGGEWRVERPRICLADPRRGARRRGREIGIPKVDDFNRGDNEGSAYFEVNQRRGRRWSAARGFLKPILNRPNLRVDRRPCRADPLRGRRAVGVRYARTAGATRRARGARSSSPPARSARRSCCELSGVGRPELSSAIGAHGRPRAARRRREPAGPSAAADAFSARRRAHAQRRLSLAVQRALMAARLRAAPAWAGDHGAVAARHFARSRPTSPPPISSSMSSRCRSTGSASRCTPFPPSR